MPEKDKKERRERESGTVRVREIRRTSANFLVMEREEERTERQIVPGLFGVRVRVRVSPTASHGWLSVASGETH